ncbi:MAG: DUF4215 domain-containing protein [Bacteroidales bacterium]
MQAEVRKIQLTQLGNLIDPYNKDNAYTYNFTGFELESDETNKIDPTLGATYLSTIVNSYEKCLITLTWLILKKSGVNYGLRLIRTTYTIKTHVNYISKTATEFFSTGMYVNDIVDSNIANSNFRPVCNAPTRYYWHPYKKLFFYIDTVNAEKYLVFTCIPYTSTPITSCDVNFGTGNSVFGRFKITGMTIGSKTVTKFNDAITFSKTGIEMAYVSVKVLEGGKYYDSIYRMNFPDSCTAGSTVSMGDLVYSREGTINSLGITYLVAIHNVGIGFVIDGVKGIMISHMDLAGVFKKTEPISGTDTWKLYQMGIDSGDPPPVFAIPDSNKMKLYRVTNIATEIFSNNSLNLYDNPADVGRFHFMTVQAGACNGINGDYNKISIHYINLETNIVDMCVTETKDGVCGNGILEGGEECDDGNNFVAGLKPDANRLGDGCSEVCKIEDGWRCSNVPYSTKTQCKPNECGDSFINTEDPEFENCDDGNLESGDGCNITCQKERGWFCPLPGLACIKVCSNDKLDSYPGPPLYWEPYHEECDDGPGAFISDDGNLL